MNNKLILKTQIPEYLKRKLQNNFKDAFNPVLFWLETMTIRNSTMVYYRIREKGSMEIVKTFLGWGGIYSIDFHKFSIEYMNPESGLWYDVLQYEQHGDLKNKSIVINDDDIESILKNKYMVLDYKDLQGWIYINPLKWVKDHVSEMSSFVKPVYGHKIDIEGKIFDLNQTGGSNKEIDFFGDGAGFRYIFNSKNAASNFILGLEERFKNFAVDSKITEMYKDIQSGKIPLEIFYKIMNKDGE